MAWCAILSELLRKSQILKTNWLCLWWKLAIHLDKISIIWQVMGPDHRTYPEKKGFIFLSSAVTSANAVIEKLISVVGIGGTLCLRSLNFTLIFHPYLSYLLKRWKNSSVVISFVLEVQLWLDPWFLVLGGAISSKMDTYICLFAQVLILYIERSIY